MDEKLEKSEVYLAFTFDFVFVAYEKTPKYYNGPDPPKEIHLTTYFEDSDWNTYTKRGVAYVHYQYNLFALKINNPVRDLFAVQHGKMAKLIIFHEDQMAILNYYGRKQALMGFEPSTYIKEISGE